MSQDLSSKGSPTLSAHPRFQRIFGLIWGFLLLPGTHFFLGAGVYKGMFPFGISVPSRGLKPNLGVYCFSCSNWPFLRRFLGQCSLSGSFILSPVSGPTGWCLCFPGGPGLSLPRGLPMTECHWRWFVREGNEKTINHKHALNGPLQRPYLRILSESTSFECLPLG